MYFALNAGGSTERSRHHFWSPLEDLEAQQSGLFEQTAMRGEGYTATANGVSHGGKSPFFQTTLDVVFTS
jgi:hypothetical protein